ncbi:PARP10_14_15 [Mytilus edulis]|uniref:PARP10_14_15 n=1 Tax=Mytilus edulis TaxID=6550 RepID=A0A8S3UNW2_MYTED|nr:PARP10_14_15 [Mytilus edulis]
MYAESKAAVEVCRRSHVVDSHELCVLMHHKTYQGNNLMNGRIVFTLDTIPFDIITSPCSRAFTTKKHDKLTCFFDLLVINCCNVSTVINFIKAKLCRNISRHHYYNDMVAVEKFRNPESVKIQSIDHRKLEFLMNLPTEKAVFENDLLSNHARVKWPVEIKINCTVEIISALTKHTENCFSLSKIWATAITKQTEKFFDKLCVHELDISQVVWDKVMTYLQTERKQVIVKADKKLHKVFIVGHKISANEMTKIIEDIIETDFQKRKYHCIEKFNIKDVYTSVCVSCGAFSDQFIQYISMPEVSNFVENKFEKKNIFGVWEFHEGNVIKMYSHSEDKAKLAEDILRKSIFNREINISGSNYFALESKQWLEELKAIQRNYQKAIITVFTVHEISTKKVFVYSISSEAVSHVHREINRFLSKSDTSKHPCIIEEMFKINKRQIRTNKWIALTGQSIYTRIGDITCLDVDVIVNPVNKELQLRRGLSKTIRDKGGKSTEKEFYDLTKQQRMLQEGDVLYTTAGNLPWIVHAISPQWTEGDNKIINLYKCVKRSFQTANRLKCASIAIPALSAGISSFPANLSTKTIVKSIRDYIKEKGRDSSIQHVYLCDINNDTVGYFESALYAYFPQPRQHLRQFVEF